MTLVPSPHGTRWATAALISALSAACGGAQAPLPTDAGTLDAGPHVHADAAPVAVDAADAQDAAPSSLDGQAPDATAPDATAPDAAAPDAAPLRCPTIGAATTLGQIADPRLAELSGLAASPTQPEILWAHHDNAAVVFALDRTTLAVRARYTIVAGGDRAPTGDVEDMAIGGGALYLGDIGSNHAGDDLTIYRALEPTVPAASVDGELSAEAMTVDPGPLGDAETLLLDPIDGHLFIVEKDSRPYVCDVGTFRSGASTPPACGTRLREPANPSGGAISPDGRWIVLRNEGEAFLWHRPAGGELLAAFVVPPGLRCPMPTLATPTNSDECNGEAITFAADGLGLITASERASGSDRMCPDTSVHTYTLSP